MDVTLSIVLVISLAWFALYANGARVRIRDLEHAKIKQAAEIEHCLTIIREREDRHRDTLEAFGSVTALHRENASKFEALYRDQLALAHATVFTVKPPNNDIDFDDPPTVAGADRAVVDSRRAADERRKNPLSLGFVPVSIMDDAIAPIHRASAEGDDTEV